MPSKGAKKAQKASKGGKGGKAASKNVNGNAENGEIDIKSLLTMEVAQDEVVKQLLEACSSTGVLNSHSESRDIQLTNVSITHHGVNILEDTTIELNFGRRYGLLGHNGCGKSTMLTLLGEREFPIPDHVDIFHLRKEIDACDKTALQAVMDVDAERIFLERRAEELSAMGDQYADLLSDIYDRLDLMDANKAQTRCCELLYGLGFSKTMMHGKCKDFSGGWRMRVALARALFISPKLLLLDEPTNHLDLEACVWLEEELKEYTKCLVIVSHSQDFLNNVCTNIIHWQNNKLVYYGGNFDTYIRTRSELEENQMKRYNWEQEQIKNMKDYIARFGHGSAKLARQAQSKEKTLAKMVQAGLTEKISTEHSLSFDFPDCGKIPPPVIMVQNVCFKYNEDAALIYQDLEFGIDLDSRVALVGPNGAGKSTLLKLIDGTLDPTSGFVRKNSHIRIGRFHQHLNDILDLTLNSIEFMQKSFPDLRDIEQVRKIVGRYGLTGKSQTKPIGHLSDGQACRIIFAWMAQQTPHMLLLDEPTNHLDIETIDSLADAIRRFEGGLILVSHDFRLINQVAEEIWVCEHKTVTKWHGDIVEYKEHLKKNVMKGYKNEKKRLAELAT